MQKIAISTPSHNFFGLYLRSYGTYGQSELDGCIVRNAHNTVLGEEELGYLCDYVSTRKFTVTITQCNASVAHLSRNVVPCDQPAGQGNDWVDWLDSNGIHGKPTFHRRANLSWLSTICNHLEKSRSKVGSCVKIFTKSCLSGKDPLPANFHKCFPKGFITS